MEFTTLNALIDAYPSLKQKRKLHPLTEKRLSSILRAIYSDAYPRAEPGEVPGGRSDLAFYFGNGRYAVFEIFATVSQVPQDLRHLELSAAQARIAILADQALDGGKILEEYFIKRSRNPFPWVRLSDVLVTSKEEAVSAQLKDIIDDAFAQQISDDEPVGIPDLRLKLYNMGRDRTLKDEICLNTNKAYPQIHSFGIGLVNLIESSIAQDISIRVEVSSRSSLSKGPVFKTPTGQGWKAQVNQLLEEQVAVLVFNDPQIPCLHNQPLEWDSFTVQFQEPVQGFLQLDYKVSSLHRFSEHKGVLIISLGTK